MDDAAVAEAANVTAAWLSAVKNDRIKSPPLDKLLAVAEVCGVPGRYLTEPLGVVPLAEAGTDVVMTGLGDRVVVHYRRSRQGAWSKIWRRDYGRCRRTELMRRRGRRARKTPPGPEAGGWTWRRRNTAHVVQ